MTRILPPRRGFDGSPVQRLARGTWLEPETIAYDAGQARRGRAVFPDGVVRSVRAGIADTYFSIPAHSRIAGRYVAGYVTAATASGLSTPTDDDPAYWEFVPYTGRPCRSTYSGARFDTGRAIRCDGTVPVGWADGSRGTCSMVQSVGTHGNGFAARYWTDDAAPCAVCGIAARVHVASVAGHVFTVRED